MTLTERQKHLLKKFVKELIQYKGRHTELVSVYIPQDYDMIKIINHLNQEQGTATNIKSTSTRKNVIMALEKMIQHLKVVGRTPENGLAAFAGNVAEREGQEDVRVWSIEPPTPLKTRIYRCDKEFVLDLLIDMMEVKEVYGLIVMDRREADIAYLKGKTIITLESKKSNVPGKSKAGGQCIIPSTIIQSFDGLLPKIEIVHNPYKVKSMIIDNYSIKDSPITDKWIIKKKEIYKIKTIYPQLIIECSRDHLFFVMTDNGLIQKPAEELKENEYLIMPEKIDIKGKTQKLDSKQYYNSFIIDQKGQKLLIEKRKVKKLLQRQLAKRIGLTQTAISFVEIGKNNISSHLLKQLCEILDIPFKEFLQKYTLPRYHQGSNIKLPEMLDENFAQFLGYYIGDGCIETDRVTFFEQREDVAVTYKKKFDKYFNLNSGYVFRKSKNYHQLRFVSRPLVRLIKEEFPEIKKTLTTQIPNKILQSPKEIIAEFLRGLFDAEGYVGEGCIGIGSNNKTIIKQTQLLLLRYSILSSFREYDNKKNPYSTNPIFKLQINEKKSLDLFKDNIGFTSEEKSNKLIQLIKKKSDKSSVRQILYPGKEVRKIIEKHGMIKQQFPKVSNFFLNKRMMSKQTFKSSILDYVKDKKLYKKLEEIYKIPIIPVKINKIEIINKETKMVDISIKDESFIADGLIVHNSAHRFERLREDAAKEFYKRCAEAVKKEFLGNKNLKGIIVGGPGPTKYDFINYITTEVKNKIIGIKDLSYTGDFGLHELVDKSGDILSAEDITSEKKIMIKFFESLAKTPNKVSYGIDEVKKVLEMGVAETLLLSEELEDNVIDEFEEIAKRFKTEVIIISTETREGAQLRDIGKVAALLRYEVHQ